MTEQFSMKISGGALKVAIEACIARELDEDRVRLLTLVADNLVAEDPYFVSLHDLADLTAVRKAPLNPEDLLAKLPPLFQSFMPKPTTSPSDEEQEAIAFAKGEAAGRESAAFHAGMKAGREEASKVES